VGLQPANRPRVERRAASVSSIKPLQFIADVPRTRAHVRGRIKGIAVELAARAPGGSEIRQLPHSYIGAFRQVGGQRQLLAASPRFEVRYSISTGRSSAGWSRSVILRLGRCCFPFIYLGPMMPDHATGCCARHGMMARHMPDDTADCGAFQTTVGITHAGQQSDRCRNCNSQP
jgi:hypothetical protein